MVILEHLYPATLETRPTHNFPGLGTNKSSFCFELNFYTNDSIFFLNPEKEKEVRANSIIFLFFFRGMITVFEYK